MDDYFFMEWPVGIHILFWVCVFVAFLPLYKIFNKSFNSKNLSIFLSKTITDEVTDHVEEPDLTSIEFKELFSFVMKIALASNRARRIVIVIDNLDRLKNNDDEQVWSMLKSFIDHSSFDSEVDDWINRLWVVIPRADNQNKEADFFEKIFQLKFILPPPVSINWHQYLKDLLINSFAEISSQEAEKIKDIFDWHVINGNVQTPTPRNIKTFINDLVWLVTLWERSFSKVILASYLLDTNKLESSFVDALTNKKIPSRLALNLLGKNLDDAYASIYFNIEDARQAKSFIYVPRFEDLLRVGDTKEINNIIKLNAYSVAYLGTAIRRLLPNAGVLTPRIYFNCIIAMHSVMENFYELFRIHLTTSLEIALSELDELPGLPLIEKNANKGLTTLLVMHDEQSEKVRKKVINALQNSKLSETTPLSFRPDINTTREWCQNFNSLINDFDLKETFSQFDEYSFALPLGVNEWRLFIEYHQNQFDFYKIFKPCVSHEEIVAHLQLLNFDELKKILLLWVYKLNFSELYQEVLDKVSSEILDIALTDSQIENVLELILEAKNIEAVFEFADNLHSSEIFFLYLGKATILSDEFLGKLILCILLVDPGLDLVSGSNSDANSGKSFISQFLSYPEKRMDLLEIMAQLVEDYELERCIIDYALQFKNYNKFASSIFNQHSNKSQIYQQFDVDKLNLELQKFLTVVSEDPINSNFRNQSIQYLVKNKNLIDGITKSQITANGFYIYAPIIEIYWNEASGLINKLSEYFKTLNTAGWKSIVISYTSSTRALGKLPSLKINKNLETALKSILSDAISHDARAFKVAYVHLSQRSKNKLAIYALNLISESKKTFNNNFWASLETVLIENLANLKKDIPSLMNSLINNRDWIGLDRVSSFLIEKPLIDVYSDEINLIRSKLTTVAKSVGVQEKRVISNAKHAIKRDAKQLMKVRRNKAKIKLE